VDIMLLKELQEQVLSLPQNDQLALVSAIIVSLQEKSISVGDGQKRLVSKRSHAIGQMEGLLKTAQPAPTDEEVAVMLEERRGEKYLL
jgi:hypothetical protein